jgi:hypothetical protein
MLIIIADGKRIALEGVQEENAERHVKFNIDFDEWRRYLPQPKKHLPSSDWDECEWHYILFFSPYLFTRTRQNTPTGPCIVSFNVFFSFDAIHLSSSEEEKLP